ncbi:hypothetical protein Tco_0914014 [Tanacetum coccineum]
MVSDEGMVNPKLLPEGSHGDKDLERFKPPDNIEPLTTLVVDLSEIDAKYQADQTQSTRLRYRSLTKNKGKTSSGVEPDSQTLLLTTTADVQALLLSDEDLMKESEDDVFEAEDEMDEDIHHTDEEETQSPSPNKDQPELSHAQDTESNFNSSYPEALKKYDNILPLIEIQLEAAASYADLKSEIEGFHDAAYKVHKGTEAAFNTYGKLIVKFQAQYMETDIQEKDKKKAKRTKPSTEWKRQSQIEAKVSQSQKVNPDKVKSQPSEENTT